LRQIKDEPALSMIPVVVFTSSREKRDLEAAYRLGVNAYVVKPTNFNDFIDAVKQLGAFWAILNEPAPANTSVADAHNR
jgi:CheY-like chemotaxis protein